MRNSIRLARFLTIVAMAVLVTGLLCCMPAIASPPLTVRLSLETAPTISLGEPIIGHYAIANASSQDLLCWIGPQTNGCLIPSDTLSGRTLPQDQCPYVLADPSDGMIRASANRVHQGYFVINGWHEAGEHVLSLAVHFTYNLKVENVSPGYPDYRKDNPSIDQTFNTTVTVLPTDLKRLRETAAELRRFILKKSDYEHHPMFIIALFSMPGTLVHESWARLVSDPGTRQLDQDYIAQQLALIPSVEAADLLAYQDWSQPPLCSYHFIPQDALANMYNNGDTALRQHIRGLYAQHGEQIPDKIEIPQVGD